MSFLNIHGETTSNTMISNAFIDHYMKDANDAQLKVYLYLVRMVSAGQPVGITDIADKFNHTEKEVVRALCYWEKAGVMHLEYDSAHTLTGIHFCELNNGPLSSVETAATELPRRQNHAHREVAAQSISGNIRHIPVPVVPAKPSYTIAELKSFKQREEIQQLLFITEQYLAKPLTQTDIRSLMYIHEELRFDTSLIDYLIQYSVEHGRNDLRHIEKIAITWAEADIRTTEMAQRYVRGYDDNLQTVCTALGRTAVPSAAEAEFYRRWTNEFGFSPDIILEACKRACLATDKHRFEYTNGILNNWHESGLNTLAEITRSEENFKSSRTALGTTNRKPKNQFNSFQQNTYDFTELERELLSN